MSKRTVIASNMTSRANKGLPAMTSQQWLQIIYAFEAAGYQVVKNSETAEFQGLRNLGDAQD